MEAGRANFRESLRNERRADAAGHLLFAFELRQRLAQLVAEQPCLARANGDARRGRLGAGQRANLRHIRQCLSSHDVQHTQAAVATVHATDTLLDYVQRLVAYTRQDDRFTFGLSPRGAQALMRAARTWALMHDRNHVLPEDVQMVLPSVVDHRLRSVSDNSGRSAEAYSQRLLTEVDIF